MILFAKTIIIYYIAAIIVLFLSKNPKQIFMKLRLSFLLAAMLLTTFYSCVQNSPEGTDGLPAIMVNEEEAVPGIISIKFDVPTGESLEANLAAEGTRAFAGMSQFEAVYESLNITRMERSFPHAGKFEERTRKAGLHLWYNIYFDEKTTVTRAANEFNGLPGVDIIDPVYKIYLIDYSPAIPLTMDELSDICTRAEEVNYPFDDPQLPDQWHYHNDGSMRLSVEGADINLFRAWKSQSGHPDVVVAIVDGGLDYNHPDLRGNYWINQAELNGTARQDDDGNGYIDDIYGWNFVDNTNVVEPMDHGVHVGGTVAAVSNNGIGVAGIAGGNGEENSGVKIMSCQVFKTNPANPNQPFGGDTALAIKYGADSGAVISQNSWTSYRTFNPRVQEAIDYFIEHAGTDENGNQVGPMKGGIVIFGAANENSSAAHYPAAYEKVVSVAAMGPNYKKAYYSNYGSWISITAPGGDVTYGTQNAVLSTLPNNSYGYMQGTSMACPHISGIVALMVSQYGVGTQGYTPAMLRTKLLASVNDINQYNPNYLDLMGTGYVDTAKAIYEDNKIAPDKVEDLEAEWSFTHVDLAWTINEDRDNYMPSEYRLYLSTSETIDTENPKAVINISRTADIGDKLTSRISNLEQGTEYYVAIAGVDMFGNVGELAVTKGSTIGSAPPVLSKEIEDIYINDLTTPYTIDLSQHFSDPDKDPLSYRVEMATIGVLATRTEGNNLIITPLRIGNTDITVTASDVSNSVSDTFNVFVRDGSKDMDLYPNPVSDKLNIQMGPEVDGTARIKLYNSTGMLAYDSDVTIKPREPGSVSVGNLAPGAYTVTVTFNGKEYKGRVVKI